MHHNIYLNPTGAQGSESTHYYYGNYRYHSRYPSDERDLNMFVQTMKDIECEDRPTVHATMARESVSLVSPYYTDSMLLMGSIF